MNHKPRILMVNEFSGLATGYSTYGMEVLSRLYASGKYEVAELACYIAPGDPRLKQVPWQVFTNYPDPSNPQETMAYNAKSGNEFGGFAFERVCIEYMPDIVFDIRDWWMLEFAERSPFRRLFKWAIMPTVDASPQHEQWLASFMNADAVFSYTDWGAQTLREEGGTLIKVQGSAPPGADIKTFLPMNKVELRRKFGFEDGINIIGTVMRNQPRKLYPELIEAFVEFQEKAPAYIAQKTYLYLHTSYPDQGWDIPRLIKQSGMSHRTLVTYKCRSCNAVFPSYFMDVVGPCTGCGKVTAAMPNTQEGVDRSTLARIINLFDCYIQYANSEGFGMPMVEAASCGIPVFATDYSAMSDVVRKVSGYPIEVQKYGIDHNFGCNRAVPSNSDLVGKLIKFFSLPDEERKRRSTKARQGVEKHYTWEATTEKWMRVFDSMMKSDSQSSGGYLGISPKTKLESTKSGKGPANQHATRQLAKSMSTPDVETTPNSQLTHTDLSTIADRWGLPPRLHSSITMPPMLPTGNNEEIVRWAILNVLGRPDLQNSYLSLRLIRDLNWGMSVKTLAGNYANEDSFLATRGNLKSFTVNDMINELTTMCNTNNYWEQKRWKAIQNANS